MIRAWGTFSAAALGDVKRSCSQNQKQIHHGGTETRRKTENNSTKSAPNCRRDRSLGWTGLALPQSTRLLLFPPCLRASVVDFRFTLTKKEICSCSRFVVRLLLLQAPVQELAGHWRCNWPRSARSWRWLT